MNTAVAYEEDNPLERHLPALHAVPNLPATVEAFSTTENKIVLSLQNLSDDEILITRQQSKIAGRFAWRIEVACDAQLMARTQTMRGKRGAIQDERGVVAAIRRRARTIGVTPNTIYNNNRLFKLIQDAEDNPEHISLLSVLDEKGYWQAALSSKSPKEVLFLLAQEKISRKRFRVSDAFRFIKDNKLSTKVAAENASASIRTASRSVRFTYLKRLEGLLEVCPDQDLLSRLNLKECLGDVRDEVGSMYDEDILTALKKSCSPECNTEQQLSSTTGFSLTDVSRILNYSEDDFDLIPNTEPQRWALHSANS